MIITGGAGFIGSHLAEKLDAVIYDNFSTGKQSNVPKETKVIKGDIKDYDKLKRAIKGHDIVIHQAYPYGLATRELDKQFIDDGSGTYNVFRACIENDVRKVIYASTVAVYGKQKYLPIDERHPKNPFLPYGATKYVGELYGESLKNVYGLDVVSLRYFNVYGERYAVYDHSALVKFLTRTMNNETLYIYGDGSQVRDYTYISDVVDGTIKALNGSGVYNIARGEGITILDLAEKIIKITKSNSKIIFKNPTSKRGLPYGLTTEDKDERNYIADISKAKEIGYQPKISIEEGIERTYRWLAQ